MPERPAPNWLNNAEFAAVRMLMQQEQSTTGEPLVWVIQTMRTGDSAQARALADALGWPQELKTLRFNALFNCPNTFLGGTLASLKGYSKPLLQPPWPDLVIAVARRTVPVARWIKDQNGGRTQLVQLGRPRLDSSNFDLVVTTPQYGVADHPNVLQIPVPLHQPITQRPSVSVTLQNELSFLPRPWFSIVLGGEPWPYRMNGAAVSNLVSEMNKLTKGNGTCIICTSPRTPKGISAQLTWSLQSQTHLFDWAPNEQNPYLNLLELSDELIVSGDSASMLAEACRHDKPVHIFDLPKRRFAEVLATIGGRLAQTGLMGRPRNMGRLHDAVITTGAAKYLGDGNDGAPVTLPDPMPLVVKRVKQLFDQN